MTILPTHDECTYETCKIPQECNEKIGSPLCLKMREKYIRNHSKPKKKKRENSLPFINP